MSTASLRPHCRRTACHARGLVVAAGGEDAAGSVVNAVYFAHNGWRQWITEAQGTGASATPLASAQRAGHAVPRRLRWNLAALGIRMVPPNRTGTRRTQDGRELRCYKRRWKVGRLFSWLGFSRRLTVRYERYIEKSAPPLSLPSAIRD